jgi:hypothetical protein
VKIESIDPDEKRISLSLAGEMTDDAAAASEENDVRKYMQKHEKPASDDAVGTLGEILKAKLKEKERE